MKKHVILLLFILFSAHHLLAQTERDSIIGDLEYDLLWVGASGQYGDKVAVARNLLSIDAFNRSAAEYIVRYYYDRKIDSISIFFDKLAMEHPNSTTPYLLRSKYVAYEKPGEDDRFFKRAEYLTKAYQIDPSDVDINLNLAELYYFDFIKLYVKRMTYLDSSFFEDEDTAENTEAPKLVSSSASPADSALFYLQNTEKINPDLKNRVYFPTQQIKTYLDSSHVVKLDLTMGLDENSFFPAWYFLNLTDKWESDWSIDYLFDAKRSISITNGLKYFLELVGEAPLYTRELLPETEVFRFSWLRTFDKPIVLVAERNGAETVLQWKSLSGAGGYEYGTLEASESRKMSEKEWRNFKSLFEQTKFQTLPNYVYFPSTDGASWTIEYKDGDQFKAQDSNSPSEAIVKCCTYLLGLTDLGIEEDRIY